MQERFPRYIFPFFSRSKSVCRIFFFKKHPYPPPPRPRPSKDKWLAPYKKVRLHADIARHDLNVKSSWQSSLLAKGKAGSQLLLNCQKSPIVPSCPLLLALLTVTIYCSFMNRLGSANIFQDIPR